MNRIKELRRGINKIDGSIVLLLAKRLALSEKIAREKTRCRIGLIDKIREQEVIVAAEKKALELGLERDAVIGIFSDIIHLSRERQMKHLPLKALSRAKLQVAFQGEPGAYSESAIKKILPNAGACPKTQFEDVFDSLESDDADCALVPVENCTEGSVNQVYDLLLQRNVSAIAEVFMRIEHMLIANPEAERMEGIYSHPQALAQCHGFITRNKLTPRPFHDTAAAVKMLKEKRVMDAAAIASESAAAMHGMKIVARSIEDNKNNYTRFLLVARKGDETAIAKLLPKSKKYKISLIFGLPHAPGSLHSVLGEIAKEGINLTKIESRPTKKTPWEYTFHVDFEADIKDAKVKRLLERVRRRTTFMKVVGCYPSGV
ncbi:prephenate dehydratase [Candidatus Micrarchaeota archaeon]|nr:prephenate dehydratase [Candidatus Micrarchaeota archaeon]